MERSIVEAEEKDGSGDSIDFSPQSLTIMYNNLSAVHRQNNTKWAQHARLIWVQNGDNNSSFFNSVSFRNHYNTITNIMDLNGMIFTDLLSISLNFISFFSDL